MLYLHTALQLAGLILALYALYLGWLRTQSRHFGRKTQFPQIRHARCGRLAVLLWLAGAAVAVAGTIQAGGWPAPEPHALLGALVILLGLFVFILGQALLRPKTPAGRRNRLAIAHGAAGLFLGILAVIQCLGGFALL